MIGRTNAVVGGGQVKQINFSARRDGMEFQPVLYYDKDQGMFIKVSRAILAREGDTLLCVSNYKLTDATSFPHTETFESINSIYTVYFMNDSKTFLIHIDKIIVDGSHDFYNYYS